MSKAGDTVKKVVVPTIIGGVVGGPIGAGLGLAKGAKDVAKSYVKSQTDDVTKSLEQVKSQNAITTMPTPDDEAVRRSKRKSIIAQAQRSGRSSTILSDQSERLGG